MVTRLGLLCMLLIAFGSTACGQAPDPIKAANQGDLDALRNELKADVAKIDAAIAKLADKISVSAHPIEMESEAIEPVQPAGPDELHPALTLAERVEKLEAGLQMMQRVQGDHGTRLAQIATLGETGYHVRFDTNSQLAREELRRAIKSTTPPEGRFIIRNLTGSDQYMAVNGYEHRVAPHKTRSVTVRPGTVVSRLRGQQRYTWHVGVPDFTQVVEIHQSEPQYIAQWVGF